MTKKKRIGSPSPAKKKSGSSSGKRPLEQVSLGESSTMANRPQERVTAADVGKVSFAPSEMRLPPGVRVSRGNDRGVFSRQGWNNEDTVLKRALEGEVNHQIADEVLKFINRNLVQTGDLSFINNIRPDEFEYVGFNPKILCDKLLRRAKAHNKSQESFMDDMSLAIAVYHIRGNNIRKIIETVSPEARARLELLRDIYNISSKVGADKKDAITLGRIAAIFPALTGNVSLKVPNQILMAQKMEMPQDACFLNFASVIPQVYEEVLTKATAAAQFQYGMVLSGGSYAATKMVSIVNNIERFAALPGKSPMLTEAERLEFSLRIGFVVDNNGRYILCDQIQLLAEYWDRVKSSTVMGVKIEFAFPKMIVPPLEGEQPREEAQQEMDVAQ